MFAVLPATAGYRTSPQIRALRLCPFWPQFWPSQSTWCGLFQALAIYKARVARGHCPIWQGQTDLRLPPRAVDSCLPRITLPSWGGLQPARPPNPSSCWCLGPKGDGQGRWRTLGPPPMCLSPRCDQTSAEGTVLLQVGAVEAGHSQPARPAAGAFLASGPEGSACRVLRDPLRSTSAASGREPPTR